MQSLTEVERVFGELDALRSLLENSKDLSARSNFESLAAKSLLLSAASFFERHICDMIMDCAKTNGTPLPVAEFMWRQALSRKYHTMFDWKVSNLNKFFALFGESAKQSLMDAALQDGAKKSIDAFIYINNQRNNLVHQNYATYSLEATFQEIWDKYQEAAKFCTWFDQKLKDIFNSQKSN
jgi:RiboL-PSP-HEPN